MILSKLIIILKSLLKNKMKATDIFKDKNFINCLKKRTFDEKGKHIEIFDEKNEIIKENINKVIKIICPDY